MTNAVTSYAVDRFDHAAKRPTTNAATCCLQHATANQPTTNAATSYPQHATHGLN